MQRQDAEGKAARAAMAKLSGATPESFDGQLSTTHLYADPKAAVAATVDPALVKTMTQVRDFSFSKGLFKGASSADAVGIAFPGGKTLGDPRRVTLRRSEEHTSELQSLMRISYAVFCLKKKNKPKKSTYANHELTTYKQKHKHRN